MKSRWKGPDTTTATSNPNSSEELIESRVNSEMELLSANDVLERAVGYRANLLHLADVPAPGSRDMARARRKMSNELRLTPVRKTTVLEVSYRDRSPATAQAVLQEITHAYLDKHLKVLRPEGTLKLFGDRAAQTDKALMETQTEMVNFQLANGVTSVAEEKEELAKQLATVRENLLSEQSQVAGEDAQLAALHLALAGGPGAAIPERIHTASRISSNVYAMQQLPSILVELQNKRTQLLTRFQPGDKLVTEADTQIANTTAALDGLKSDPTVEKDTDMNPVWNQMQQQLHGTRVALASSHARLASLRDEEAHLNARLAQMQRITVESDRLERNLAELRDSEKPYSSKSEHERLEDVLDRDRVGNIAVAMEPTFSASPVSPHVLLSLVLGFTTAVVCCLAVLFVLETKRASVLTPTELEDAAGLNVLGVIPDSCTTTPPRARAEHVSPAANRSGQREPPSPQEQRISRIATALFAAHAA